MSFAMNQRLQDTEVINTMTIKNAGLCLLSPWIGFIFRRFELLTDDRRDFKDQDARIRAIFCLEYLINKDKRELTEEDFVFSRLLTNCPADVTLPTSSTLTETEKKLLDEVFPSVKANWDKMHNTPEEVFRKSFIERPGKLVQGKNQWELHVDESAFDVLIDTVPWTFKQITYPWLENPIRVFWYENERR